MKAKYWPCQSVKLCSGIGHTLDSVADSAGPLMQEAKINICYRVVLSEAERVRELSRMLAGVEESDSGLAHARELLEAARSGP